MLPRFLVWFGCAVALTAQVPQFAAPIRIQVDGAFLGGKKLYPSPVWHDLDGDGVLDLVVGDLPGRIVVARGLGGQPPAYAKEVALERAKGTRLQFHNW